MRPEELIDVTVNTLNGITLSGAENMEKMLGAIRALNVLKEALQEAGSKKKEGEQNA